MKRIRRAYSKTVSLIDETAVQIYESFVGKRKGFLLESYDKNNGRDADALCHGSRRLFIVARHHDKLPHAQRMQRRDGSRRIRPQRIRDADDRPQHAGDGQI